MTSQPGLQAIAKLILPNISQSKGNQTMKISRLKNITGEIIFFKNYEENEARRLVPNLFLFFEKA